MGSVGFVNGTVRPLVALDNILVVDAAMLVGPAAL